jgi:hypothetical protein
MKINLHSHTKYSDGCNTVFEMADQARRGGHCCYVSSDHDYRMTPEKYEKQLLDAMVSQTMAGIPIFVGLEISIGGEEANLIGTEACRAWLKGRAWEPDPEQYRAGLGNYNLKPEYYDKCWEVQENNLIAILDAYDCALVLVHPCMAAFYEDGKRRTSEFIYDLFHGYEVMNRGAMWPDDLLALMRTNMPNARQFRGMDAHSSESYEPGRYSSDSCNEIDFTPTTEEELIHWIKTGKQLGK